MANRLSSPCLTSHDTPGQSGFLLSPIESAFPRRKSLPHTKPLSKGILTPHHRRKSKIPVRESPRKPVDDGQSESEVDLSEYTFDLNKLPGELLSIGKEEGGPNDGAGNRKASILSDTEGPEDFTLNMVEYMKGVDKGETPGVEGQAKSVEDRGKDEGARYDGESEGEDRDQNDQELEGQSRANGLQDYTQLDHSMETSTPAHVLWRHTNSSLRRATSAKRQSILSSKNSNGNHSRESSVIYTPKRKSSPSTPIVDEHQLEDDNDATQEDQTLFAAQQICQLEMDVEAKCQRIKELETKLADKNSLLKEVEELKQQLQKRDTRSEISENELRELREAKTELGKVRSELAGQTSKEVSLRSDLEEKSGLLKEAEKALENTREEHRHQVEQMSAEIKQTKQESEKKLGGVYSLKFQLTATTRERDSLQSKTEELEHALQDLQTRAATAESQKVEESSESLARLREVQKLAGELSLPALGKPYFEIINLLREHVRDIKEKSTEAQKEHSKASEDTRLELQKQLKKSNGAVRLEARKAELYKDRLNEASSKLNLSKEENSELLERIAVLTCENAKLKKQAIDTMHEHDQAITALRKLRAESEDLHKSQVAELKAAHSEQLSKHRNNKQAPSSELQARLSATMNREAILTTELKAEREARDGLEEELVRMESEIAHHQMTQKRLEAIIKASTSAAKKIDGKIIDIMREREDAWKARVDELTKDNDKLSKVLMAIWGKQEVGDSSKTNKNDKGRKQGYNYKYVRKAQDVEIGKIWNGLLGEPAS